MKAAVVDSLRRERLHAVLGLIGVLVVALLATILVAGCGGNQVTSKPSATAGGIQTGGVVKVGEASGNGQWDPCLFSGVAADVLVQHQVLEPLVYLAPDLSVKGILATEWTTPEGTDQSKVWTFKLQEGVSFTNGEAFTADDVVYTMNRLRSKKLGSPLASVYANIVDVKAADPTTVVFTLKERNSEFVESLTDYRTLMLSRSVKDPMKDLIGTGPFTLESYAAEDRAVLKANPDYWGKDADGSQLPHLDGVEVISSPELAGRVEGLQGGSLNMVCALGTEEGKIIEANPKLKLLTTNSNFMTEVQIRCDQGLGKNMKFRQALAAGTDRQAIADLVAPGLSLVGNGTFVGPAYGDLFLEPKAPDPERAKQLLAEAGYGNGVEFKLVVQTAQPIPAVAIAWQEQMKEIGVDIKIQQVPPDVYYAEQGENNWYQADFGTVDWSTRALPTTYFLQALLTDAPWNYARWSNAEFDSLVKRIPLEPDLAARADLYKQAQAIIIDQVPMIQLLIQKTTLGLTRNLEGIELCPDAWQTTLRSAYFSS